MHEDGYAAHSGFVQLRLLGCFNRWLGRRGLKTEDVDFAAIEKYLRGREQSGRLRKGDSAVLFQLLSILRPNRSDAAVPPPTAREVTLRQFQQYLRQDRSLTEATVINYTPVVRSFLLQRFPTGPVRCQEISAGDITAFVQRQAAVVISKRAPLVVTALRSFLRYLFHRGIANTNFATCVPTIATWSLSKVPRFLSGEQIQKILDSCDRATVIGKRDYALLLLLARLGLRAGEVVALSLDDFDWEAGLITVRGKGKRAAQMPLPSEVGTAIADYLSTARPQCASRRLFIRAKAPLRGFANSAAVCSLVDKALERAGVDSEYRGSHVFGHCLATQMLKHGASLPEIGDFVAPSTPGHYSNLRQSGFGCVALDCPSLAGRQPMKPLRQAIEEYIALRRSLGFKLRDMADDLQTFAAFLEQKAAPFITAELAMQWAMQPAHHQPSSWAQRLGFVRVFARHWSTTDPRTEIPPAGLLPFRPQRARPYLYSEQEIQKLLAAARKLTPRQGLRPWTYHCLFGLLAVEGLRIGEALKLERTDVDLH